MLLLVAVDADVADARVRQQAQEPLDHPEPGAQHRHDGDLIARAAERSLASSGVSIVDVLERQLARDLDGHDRGGLEQRLAEVAVGGVAVAQHRQPIRQHRVLDDCQPCGTTRSYPRDRLARGHGAHESSS